MNIKIIMVSILIQILFVFNIVNSQIIDTIWSKRLIKSSDRIGWNTKEIPNGNLLVLSTNFDADTRYLFEWTQCTNGSKRR